MYNVQQKLIIKFGSFLARLLKTEVGTIPGISVEVFTCVEELESSRTADSSRDLSDTCSASTLLCVKCAQYIKIQQR